MQTDDIYICKELTNQYACYPNRKVYMCKNRQNDNNIYTMYKYPIDFEHQILENTKFLKLKQMRYISIIRPEYCFKKELANNKYICIITHNQKTCLSDITIDYGEVPRIGLQITLLMIELTKRLVNNQNIVQKLIGQKTPEIQYVNQKSTQQWNSDDSWVESEIDLEQYFHGTIQEKQIEQITSLYNYLSMKNIYWQHGLIYVMAADIDFYEDLDEGKAFKSYKETMKQLIGAKFIDPINNFQTAYQRLLQYFKIPKILSEHASQHLEYCKQQFDFLLWILMGSEQFKKRKQNDFKNIYNYGNAFIISGDTPFSLQTQFPLIKDNVIIKTQKYDPNDNEAEKGDKINNSERELEIQETLSSELRQSDRNYLVTSQCYYRIDDQLFLFLEYYEDGDLESLFKSNKSKIDRSTTYKISQQLFQGLSQFHRLNFIHRDLKPRNIFVKNKNNLNNLVLALADFDLSKKMKVDNIEQTMVLGTKGYAPEEFGQTDIYGQKSDVWTMALISTNYQFKKYKVYQIANNGDYKWNQYTYHSEAYEQIEDDLIKQGYNQQFIQIMKKCLSKKIEHRPTSHEVLSEINQLLGKVLLNERKLRLQTIIRLK